MRRSSRRTARRASSSTSRVSFRCTKEPDSRSDAALAGHASRARPASRFRRCPGARIGARGRRFSDVQPAVVRRRLRGSRFGDGDPRLALAPMPHPTGTYADTIAPEFAPPLLRDATPQADADVDFRSYHFVLHPRSASSVDVAHLARARHAQTVIAVDDVLRARETIAGRLHRTPTFTSATLSQRTGTAVTPEGRAVPAHRLVQAARRAEQAASLTAEEKARA